MAADKTQVKIYVAPDLLKEVDRLCDLGGMSRTEFVETLLEVTVETEGPLIDFSLRLGRAAKKIWPGKVRKVVPAR